MQILAIDQSSAEASVALIDGDSVLAGRSWHDDRSRGSRLFDLIDEVLKQASVSLESIGGFVVGVGPGSYTGLRTSIMAIKAMAMPDNKPVFGIGSGDAIAGRANFEQGERFVTVLGDARRAQFWYCHYELRQGVMTPLDNCLLVDSASFRSICRPGFCLVTSEWQRLGALLEEEVRQGGVRIINRPVYPEASRLGRMAANRIFKADPVEPSYLHSAVANPPQRQKC